MDTQQLLVDIMLTATVAAALITSIANIIISLLNNHRLKNIEKKKQLNEIDNIDIADYMN